jgi:hypothetical protein
VKTGAAQHEVTHVVRLLDATEQRFHFGSDDVWTLFQGLRV